MTAAPFLDVFALALVGGGSLLLASAQAGLAGARLALVVLTRTLRHRPDRRGSDAVLRAAAAMVASRGPQTLDRLRPADPFLHDALRRFSDCPDARAFAVQMARLRERARADSDRAAGWWHAMADAAPPLGMAGTVTGIIGLFGGGSVGDAGFAALSVALTSTLYGLLLSTLIAGPIAAFLDRRGAEDAAWQRDVTHRLVAILRAAAAPPVRAVRAA